MLKPRSKASVTENTLLKTLRSSSVSAFRSWVSVAHKRTRSPVLDVYVPREQVPVHAFADTPAAENSRRASVFREPGRGRTPTIVLGGFVPDACDQVLLMRRMLLAAGDVYYINYPRSHFSIEAIFAQLDELVADLNRSHQYPVIFSVSFGAGILLQWLRARSQTKAPYSTLAGLVLVSPVACLEDVLSTTSAKPSTLLGRALAPFLNPHRPLTEANLEKSRLVFKRMFDAGAQNKKALHRLLSTQDVTRLRANVSACIRDITMTGSIERVRALTSMTPLTEGFSPSLLPLASVPTLILFAESEDSVLEAKSPTRFALEHATRAYFPQGRAERVVSRTLDNPVQHASLIFHAYDFLGHLQGFYREVRPAKLPIAA